MRISRLSSALVFVAAGSLFGATISVQPPTINVIEGHTFSLNVDIANITDLYAFQFDLGFDPTILAAVSVTEGSFLPAGGSTLFFPGTVDNVAGNVTFIADSLVGSIPGVSGGGTLASIAFDVLASGTTPISLLNIQLLDSNLDLLDFSVSNGSVASTVPEPSSLPLIAFALLAGYSLKARRSRRV